MARADGRVDDELRPVNVVTDFIIYPEGSVLIEMGGTRVLCNASVEEKVPTWREASGTRGTEKFRSVKSLLQPRSPS